MKKIDTAGLLNKIAVAMLLVASATYHVQQGLRAKKNDLQSAPGEEFWQSTFHNASLPSALPFFIFPKQNLINHKPIYLCVK